MVKPKTMFGQWAALARDIALLRAAIIESLPRRGRFDKMLVDAKWRAINNAKWFNRAVREAERTEWCVDCGELPSEDWDRPADEHVAGLAYDGDPLCSLCAAARHDAHLERLQENGL